MLREYEKLFEVLEEFLDACDPCLEGSGLIEITVWYKKINRALDAVYRKESGIPPAPRVGRPPKEDADGHR